MKQISTPATTESKATDDKECEQQGTIPAGALLVPSQRSIFNILAFSRSFEVQKSDLLGNLEIYKN